MDNLDDAATSKPSASTSTNVTVNTPGKLVVETKECDIILGRGKNANNRPGNIQFRNLIAELSPKYEASATEERTLLVQQLILQIRESGARFLQSITAADSKGQMVAAYEIVSEAKALAKVKQALRDVAPTRKKKSERKVKAEAEGKPTASGVPGKPNAEGLEGLGYPTPAPSSLSRAAEVSAPQQRHSRYPLSSSFSATGGEEMTPRPAPQFSSGQMFQLPSILQQQQQQQQQLPVPDLQLAQQLRMANLLQQQGTVMTPYSHLPSRGLASHLPRHDDVDVASAQSQSSWILQQLRQREAPVERQQPLLPFLEPHKMRDLLLQQQLAGLVPNRRMADQFLQAQQPQHPLDQSTLFPKRRLQAEDEEEANHRKVARATALSLVDGLQQAPPFGAPPPAGNPYASNALSWSGPLPQQGMVSQQPAPHHGCLPIHGETPAATTAQRPTSEARQKRDSSSSSSDEGQSTRSRSSAERSEGLGEGD